MTPRYGVLGWPVGHSRSPDMMRAAGLAGYQRLPVPPELFDETARGLAAAGFRGANVTIPHKEAALALATSASDTAAEIGAANMLTLHEDGTIHADNTDAPGLMAALGRTPASALVLGAGGSARAAVWALRTAGADVAIWNRTPARAEGLGARVVATPVAAEVLVNCTSVGLEDPSNPTSPLKDLPLVADALKDYAIVVDLVYAAGATALIREAEARGVATVDGLEVLVRQGALSFTAWTGRPAPLDIMRAAVREPRNTRHGDPRTSPPTPRR